MIGFLMAGWVEGIRRALVIGLVLIAGTAIDQAPSVGHQGNYVIHLIVKYITLPDSITTLSLRCIPLVEHRQERCLQR